jgi:hypothetical protein
MTHSSSLMESDRMQRKAIEVLGTTISYVETGSGDPMCFYMVIRHHRICGVVEIGSAIREFYLGV